MTNQTETWYKQFFLYELEKNPDWDILSNLL